MARKDPRKIVVVALALCLALASAVPLLSGCGGNTPDSAVMEYLKAMESGNWEDYKASVAPGMANFTKEQEALAKQKFNQVEVTFDGIKTKTTYDKKDKNKADVELVGGKITYTAKILGEKKTEIQDIKKMKEDQRPLFPTKKVDGTWYVDMKIG